MQSMISMLLLTTALMAPVNRPAEEFATTAGPVKITPIRHASLLIQAAGQNIYVDPVKDGNYEGLPAADLILVTHAHFDHFDADRIGKLRKAGMKVIGPEAVAGKLLETMVIRAGEAKEFGGWKIEAVPAYNVKRTQPSGQPWHAKGQGIGYVLTYGGKRFYIAGDTEDVPEMRALKNIDVAFVCVNLPYTMSPEEAAEAIRAFRPKVAYPYHYSKSDLSVLEKALAGSGVEVRVRNWYY